MEVRLAQVKHEWEGTIEELEKIIKRLIMKHKTFLSQMQMAEMREWMASDAEEEFSELELAICDLKDSLREPENELQESIRSGQIFMETDVNYFLANDGSPGDVTACFPHLTQVRKTLVELHQLHPRIGIMQTTCKEMLEDSYRARKRPSRTTFHLFM
ncbi:uncharacterized protein ColSpa_11340 [Colletotrichum spaethianum]|uniref:Uncharacterized protein n=1 Tax=Colletotrichum spaethianum TaxID=700344 RepID=A0AA37PFC5_9PEZI|nr:uncharacterized protein ColSpa_11340 [Colletotrichum spaethianum]GKT51159.1 hypothetical protein ColSpa_11340 [Colletotrichum spaethianum]